MTSITPIPNLPQTTSLTGTEVVPAVQSGTTVKVPLSQIANYVLGFISGILPGVLSFNTRVGAVTLQLSDITVAGGAPTTNPVLLGVPTAPTAAPGDNSTTIANTAFVTNAVVSATAGVASFNTRTGAVTLGSADITGAGGALIASPTFTGVPAAATASPGTNTTQLATTAFVAAAEATLLPLAGGTLTGALTPAQVAGIVGTTTNNNAATGSVGEYATATQGSTLPMTTNVALNVTSISLTAGDWDVEGNVVIEPTAGAASFIAAVSTTSGGFSSPDFRGTVSQTFITPNTTIVTQPTGRARLLIASTTTVFLVAKAVFGSGTCGGAGSIQARRVR